MDRDRGRRDHRRGHRPAAMTRPASSYRDQKAREAATALPQLALGGDPRWRYSLRGASFSIPGVRLSDSLWELSQSLGQTPGDDPRHLGKLLYLGKVRTRGDGAMLVT